MENKKTITIKKPKINKRLIGRIIISLVILILVFSSFYIVNAGERGILLTFGKPSDMARGEGLHFKIPLVQSVIIMDVKTQKYEAQLSAASRDLQDVRTKIAINYHLVPDTVPELYKLAS